MEPSDDTLIATYREGDDEAFDRLYRRYAARLLGFLIGIGSGSAMAEDIAQKTWLKIITKMDRYQYNGSFQAWLFTIGHHQWVDENRQNRRRRVAESGEATQALLSERNEDPLKQIVFREDRSRLGQALKQLPSALCQTVLLRVDGGLKYRQIAQVMACPLGTVLWRMKEAERRLTRHLTGSTTQNKA